MRGKGLGNQIGWPTANLKVDGRKFLPELGVYAAWVFRPKDDKRYPAVMNLGPQPTIDPNSLSAVEVHLINQKIDLVGDELIVEPVERLRGQKKYQNIDMLTNQIGQDAKSAKKILEENN